MSTYSQKPMSVQSRQNRPLRCFAEQSFLKNKSSKHVSFGVSLDPPPPTRPGRQAIRRSNCFITIPIPYHFPRGWGVATERGGGVLRSEHQAGYRRSMYPTIPYTSQGFQIIISDWMRWITHQRAHPAIQFEWISWMKQEDGGRVWISLWARVKGTSQSWSLKTPTP